MTLLTIFLSELAGTSNYASSNCHPLAGDRGQRHSVSECDDTTCGPAQEMELGEEAFGESQVSGQLNDSNDRDGGLEVLQNYDGTDEDILNLQEMLNFCENSNVQ